MSDGPKVIYARTQNIGFPGGYVPEPDLPP